MIASARSNSKCIGFIIDILSVIISPLVY